MNKDRRKRIADAIAAFNSDTPALTSGIFDTFMEALDTLKEAIEEIKEEEQESYDNLPESFQNGDRGYEMQEAIDCMDRLIMEIEEIKMPLESLSLGDVEGL